MAPPTTTTPPRRQAAAPPPALGPKLVGPTFEQALEDRLIELLVDLNPLRRVLPFHFDPTDETGPGQASALAPWVGRPTWTFTAPAALPTPWWVRQDGTHPAPPASAANATVNAPAYEVIVSHTYSYEKADDLRLLFEPSITTPPTAAARAGAAGLVPLALALANEEQRALIAGAGTNNDPITGLANISGITTIAAGSSLIDTFVDAVADLRSNGREPLAILVGPSTEKALRKAKDSSGLYLFPPSAPMAIADVPVVEVYGIPAGASTYAFVIGSGIVPFVRPIGESRRPLEVRVSVAAKLTTDEVVVRVRERLGLASLPGIGLASIRKITGINAP
jgi:hypothetical protein